MSITRTATCACGKLSMRLGAILTASLPAPVRSASGGAGSAFNVSAYFNKSQIVAIEGPHKTFQRSSDSGRNIELHFCPDCGSTLFWYAEIFADVIGTAVGCFPRPRFPEAEGVLLGCSQDGLGALPPTFRFMRIIHRQVTISGCLRRTGKVQRTRQC